MSQTVEKGASWTFSILNKYKVNIIDNNGATLVFYLGYLLINKTMEA